MPKFPILICAFLLVGYANAQDLCTLAESIFPSVVTCTGSGAKAVLKASAKIPFGLTYTLLVPTGIKRTTISFSIAPNLCNPATATATVSDSAEVFLPLGTETLDLANGEHYYPIVENFQFPVLGKITIDLVVKMVGGIDSNTGFSFSAHVSFCIEEACDADILPTLLTSVLGDILPLEVVPLFNIPKDTFTDSELDAFCPKPKKVSGESVLYANMALVGVAVAAFFV